MLLKQGGTEPDVLRMKLLTDLLAAPAGFADISEGSGCWPDGTMACVIADGSGRAVTFSLLPRQARELPQAVGLPVRLPGVPRWMAADRGYASHAFRAHNWDHQPPAEG